MSITAHRGVPLSHRSVRVPRFECMMREKAGSIVYPGIPGIRHSDRPTAAAPILTAKPGNRPVYSPIRPLPRMHPQPLMTHSTPTTAILLIAHGSRREEANEDLRQMARAVGRRTALPIVETAYLEISEPTIPQAAQRCVTRAQTGCCWFRIFSRPERT